MGIIDCDFAVLDDSTTRETAKKIPNFKTQESYVNGLLFGQDFGKNKKVLHISSSNTRSIDESVTSLNHETALKMGRFRVVACKSRS